MSVNVADLESYRTALTGHCYRMLGSPFTFYRGAAAVMAADLAKALGVVVAHIERRLASM